MPAPQWPGQRTLSPRHDSVKVGWRRARRGLGDFGAGFVAAWRREPSHGNNRRDTRSAAGPGTGPTGPRDQARLPHLTRLEFPGTVGTDLGGIRYGIIDRVNDKRQFSTTPDSAIDQTRPQLSSGKE